MSYADTHLHRLGVNHHQIPVNKPRCPVMHYMRDGQGATAETYGSAPNYWPNTRSGAPMPDESFSDPAWDLGQAVVDRYDSTEDHDDYTQAGNLYRMFDEDHRDRLATRIAGVLGQAREEIQLRQVCHFFRADEDYGGRVASKLGIDPERVQAGAGEGAASG
jgi:catalase